MSWPPFDPVEALALKDVGLADVARLAGGRLVGDDVPITHLRRLSAPQPPPGSLCYATGERAVADVVASSFAAAIIGADPPKHAIDGRDLGAANGAGTLLSGALACCMTGAIQTRPPPSIGLTWRWCGPAPTGRSQAIGDLPGGSPPPR